VGRLSVHARAVEGTWIRHVPHGAELLGRAEVPADGRWQRGEIVPALYLADTTETATAEWYRALAEWGLSPQDHVPYDHHRWRLDLNSPTSATPTGCTRSHSTHPGQADRPGRLPERRRAAVARGMGRSDRPKCRASRIARRMRVRNRVAATWMHTLGREHRRDDPPPPRGMTT